MDPSAHQKNLQSNAIALGKRKIVTPSDEPAVVSSRKGKVVVNVGSDISEDVIVNVGNVVSTSSVQANKKCGTYMSPGKLVTLFGELSPEQQQSVKDLGLGFLADLKIRTVPTPFLAWLVHNFDYDACCFDINGHHIPVEAYDVHLVFGLPLGGIPINILRRRSAPIEDKVFEDIHSLCLADVGPGKSWPTIKAIGDTLKLHPGSTDSFKRLFLLYFVNTFLDGPTRGGVATKTFLYNLVDISAIPRLDWCGFFIHRLVESVKAVQKGEYYFTGPIVFLVLFYLDRVMYQAISHLRAFPIVKCWVEEDSKERINKESRGNGFGRGGVLPRISSPHYLDPHIGQCIRKPDFLSETRDRLDASQVSDDLECHLELIMKYTNKLSQLARNTSAEVIYIRNNFKEYLHIPRVARALKAVTSEFTTASDALKEEIHDLLPISDVIGAKQLTSPTFSPVVSSPVVHAGSGALVVSHPMVANQSEVHDVGDIIEDVPDSPVGVPHPGHDVNAELPVSVQNVGSFDTSEPANEIVNFFFKVEVCNICGDIGFENALINCSDCCEILVHQYCLGIPPGTIDIGNFNWICEFCCAQKESELCAFMKSFCASTKGKRKKRRRSAVANLGQWARKRRPAMPQTQCEIPLTLGSKSKRSRKEKTEDESSSSIKVARGKSSNSEDNNTITNSLVKCKMDCSSTSMIYCDSTTDVIPFDHGEGATILIPDEEQSKPLFTLLPIENSDKTDCKSPLMENPEEITRGVVLLVSPSGEIFIDEDENVGNI